MPLYMQLEQKKQAKEQEYLDIGKAIRAPMHGLEADDVEYYRVLQETNQHREASQKCQVSLLRTCVFRHRCRLCIVCSSAVPCRLLQLTSSLPFPSPPRHVLPPFTRALNS